MKVKSESEVAQLCPTLSDPMDCSLPGSSVHEIFQARVLEWGAIAFSAPSIYSAIIRNTFESVLVKWMILEPIIQSEVSQKEKNKYCILMHIYGIRKDGTDEINYLQGSRGHKNKEHRLTHMKVGRKERVGCME